MPRVCRIERHVRAARLEYSQDADDRLRRPPQTNAHGDIRTDVETTQPRGKRVGSPPDFTIRHFNRSALQRHRVRCPGRLGVEHVVQAVCRLIGTTRGAPLLEQDVQLFFTDEGNPAERHALADRQIPHECRKPLHHRGHGVEACVSEHCESLAALEREPHDEVVTGVGTIPNGTKLNRQWKLALGEQLRPTAQRGRAGHEVTRIGFAMRNARQLFTDAFQHDPEIVVDVEAEWDMLREHPSRVLGLRSVVVEFNVERVVNAQPCEKRAERSEKKFPLLPTMGVAFQPRVYLFRHMPGLRPECTDPGGRGRMRRAAQRDGTQRLQAVRPEAFVPRQRLVQLRQLFATFHLQQGKHAANVKLITPRSLRDRQRFAIDSRQSPHGDRPRGGGNRQQRIIHRQHRAGRSGGSQPSEPDIRGNEKVRPSPDLWQDERIEIRAKVRPSRHRLTFLAVPAPIEDATSDGPSRSGVVGPQGEILGSGRDHPPHQIRHQFGERGQPLLEALQIQAQGGFVRGHIEPALPDDGTGIDGGLHQVPRDAVGLLTVEQCP